MASAAYMLIRRAVGAEQQVTCLYHGHYRELCPHILGHTNGREKLLAFQFGGESRTSLPPGGEWRCLLVEEMQDIKCRGGAWHAGNAHRRQQTCVEVVDVDINVHVRRLRS